MSINQGEHTFEQEVLISGEEIMGFTADSALTLREPVGISGDMAVDSSSAGEGDFYGVVLYDVASGEEVAVAGANTEVWVEVSEAVSAGDELLPDGNGTFESVATSAGSNGVLLAETGSSGSGELVRAEVLSAQGATA